MRPLKAGAGSEQTQELVTPPGALLVPSGIPFEAAPASLD